MLLNTKIMAAAGVLTSCTVLMLYLSTLIESSSLFFIAAASFCVGIVIREWKMKWGFCLFTASVILNFVLIPNKLYCITFSGMGLYILLTEWIWKKIADAPVMKGRTLKFWIGKYIVFNAMYIPMLLFVPKVIWAGEMNKKLLFFLLLAGQAALFVYDYAYRYFQYAIWGKIRMKLLK